MKKEINVSVSEIRKIMRRDVDMAMRIFFPEEVLETIGEKWGLTRERVRQILSAGLRGMDIPAVKRQFRLETPYFRCVLCGKELSIKELKYKRYGTCDLCSNLIKKYDFEHPQKCDGCSMWFFPFRTTKYNKYLTAESKSFHSADCYFKYAGQHGGFRNMMRENDSKKFEQREVGENE